MANVKTKREILIFDLQRLPEDREELDTITNPIEREWRSRRIADRERLLAQLTDTERYIVEQTVICCKKADTLVEQTGLNTKEIMSVRYNAIENLCYLEYGAVYRP